MNTFPPPHRPSMLAVIRGIPPSPVADGLGIAISCLASLAVAVALVSRPPLAVLPVMALGALLLLTNPRARIIFVLFGGLLTLQSSEELTLIKLGYLAGVLAAFAGAFYDYSRRRSSVTHVLALPLVRVSLVFLLLIAFSWPVASAHGVPRTDWLRDVAPYMLFASAPIFALDAASSLSRRALVVLFVAAGGLATLSFATYWLSHRHIADLPISRFALSSFLFPAALFAYSAAAALHGTTNRMRWLGLASIVLALLLVTGARTSLALLVAPLAIAISARRYLAMRFLRLMFLTPLAIVLILLVAYSVVGLTGASAEVIDKRIAILKSTGNPKSDASYEDRLAQSHAAWKAFTEKPVFGSGPGTSFEWQTTNGLTRASFVIDSPASFPAKFGLVGLGAVAFLILSYTSFLRNAVRLDHPRVDTLAFIGYTAIAVVASFLAPPLEDKGFALGLILILALLLRSSDMPRSIPNPRGGDGRPQGT